VGEHVREDLEGLRGVDPRICVVSATSSAPSAAVGLAGTLRGRGRQAMIERIPMIDGRSRSSRAAASAVASALTLLASSTR
jgi:hypothetical protein